MLLVFMRPNRGREVNGSMSVPETLVPATKKMVKRDHGGESTLWETPKESKEKVQEGVSPVFFNALPGREIGVEGIEGAAKQGDQGERVKRKSNR